MKLNKYFMLGLVSLTFAACSNEEEKNVTTDNTEGKVYVSLSLGSAKSRSLGESAEGKTNNIKNLKVFFYTSSNQYVNYVVDQAVLNKAVTDLAKAQSATIELTEVPGSADRIYIIANEKEKNPIAIGSWAAVENTDIYLVNQVQESFTTFSNEESTMTGYSKITSNTEVTLKPVTCRLEVQNFIAQKAPASFLGKDIEKFDVKGIYINSFYAQGKLGNIADNNREQVDMKEKDSMQLPMQTINTCLMSLLMHQQKILLLHQRHIQQVTEFGKYLQCNLPTKINRKNGGDIQC